MYYVCYMLYVKHINDHYHILAVHCKLHSEMILMQHFDGLAHKLLHLVL